MNYFEAFTVDNNIDAEIIVITSLKEFINFRTWILPSIFINGKKAGRGYIPDEKTIMEFLTKPSDSTATQL